MLLQALDFLELLPPARLQAAGRRQRPVGQHHRRPRPDPPGGRERTGHALTTPLVTDTDGRKFGKSTGGGNVWLDPEMTVAVRRSTSTGSTSTTATSARYLRLFTVLGRDEIEALERRASNGRRRARRSAGSPRR